MAKLPTTYTDLSVIDQSQYGMIFFNTKTGRPVLVPMKQVTSSISGGGGDADSLMISAMQGMIAGYRMSSNKDMFQQRDLTINGSIPFTTGYNGNASSFSVNGANFFNVADSWLPTGARSVSLLVRIPGTPAANTVIMCYGTPNNDQAFYIFVDTNRKIQVSQYGNALVSATALTANVWYHVVATVSAPSAGSSTYTVYINGAIDNTNVMATNTVLGGGMFVGKGLGVGEAPMSGLIDELYLWNRVLSADEVSDLYDALAEGKSPPFFV